MEKTPLEGWIMRKAGINAPERAQLENYQLGRLRETVRYAKAESRFYAGQLQNVTAEELCSLADLRRIPFTFPQQISADPDAFLCVPQSRVRRIVTLRSSGTSGAEKRIFFTQEDLDLTTDFFEYGMKCLTDRTDRVMVLLPGNSFGSIGNLLDTALSHAGTACFVHGVVTDVRETARQIINSGATCLVGIPIQVLQLCRTQPEAFRNVKKALLSTDYVPEVLINELENRFGCKAYTHYGMTEMGYGGGVECAARSGCHMREADFCFEIVDPESGEPVEDGRSGEVVFTTLTRQAMPLIRYRTGDIASFSPRPCACGTFLKTLGRVQGRAANRIRIGEGRFLPLRELDEAVFEFREALDFKAYRKGDRMRLEIVTEGEEAFRRIKKRVAGRIEELLRGADGETAQLRVELLRRERFEPLANSMRKRTVCRGEDHGDSEHPPGL